ncbi:hypothetical protein Sjap_008258 [Stephania japonica]|uniref:KIB1-4 beta-propeller domain-containing protein n=1 Tax=Stephania japonica TaxID=461633 RepID=A0AAP0PC50_9MAGN
MKKRKTCLKSVNSTSRLLIANKTPELPDDILHVIVCKLSSLVCHSAFRSVCRVWRLFSLRYYSYLVPPQPPWLMFPASVDPPSRIHNLYTFDGGRQFFQFEVPKEYEFCWCSGTWLIFFDSKEDKIRVWNPLSSVHILLPLIPVPCYKIIASCRGPLIKDGMVFAALYPDELVFIRLGDAAWTDVKIDFLQVPRPSRTPILKINDIVFYQGKLYVVDQSGMIFVCEEDVRAPSYDDFHYRCPAKAIRLIDYIYEVENLREEANHDTEHFLVEVKGDLMLILKYSNSKNPSAYLHASFKLDFSRRKLQEMGFQNYSLFLSSTDASLSTIIPEMSCIYIKSLLRVPSDDHRFDCVLKVIGSTKGDCFKANQPSSTLFRVDEWNYDDPQPAWIIPRHAN